MYTYLYEGLRKDLKNAVKTESGSCGSSKLQDWITAIINHLYQILTSVCTTLTNRADIVEAKWKSLLNQVTNRHRHDDPLFPRCQHPKAKRGAKKKMYLSTGQIQTYILEKLQCYYLQYNYRLYVQTGLPQSVFGNNVMVFLGFLFCLYFIIRR